MWQSHPFLRRFLTKRGVLQVRSRLLHFRANSQPNGTCLGRKCELVRIMGNQLRAGRLRRYSKKSKMPRTWLPLKRCLCFQTLSTTLMQPKSGDRSILRTPGGTRASTNTLVRAICLQNSPIFRIIKPSSSILSRSSHWEARGK